MKYGINKIWLVTLILATFTTGLGSGYYLQNNKNSSPSTQQETKQNNESSSGKIDLSLFWNVVQKLDNDYVEADKIQPDKALYGAIKGMVESLGDHYTVFMDPEESKQFHQELDGTLEGIGAELSLQNKELVILSIIKHSPAEKSGLMPKDVVYKIDEVYAEDLSLFEAITKIRGKKGTDIVLTVIREGSDQPIEMKMTRDEINVDSVTYELLEGNIAYVSINQFSDNTAQELSSIISKLLLDGADGLILDLRYNGGGYLDIAVDILSELIPNKVKVVSLKRRNQVAEDFVTKGNARLSDMPLVVLINQGSASASEIVAGAIQDLKIGFLIGETSFGKGTVQEVVNLANGASLRMTIAKWYTAADRDINGVGVSPDMVVKLTREDIIDGNDLQKEAAITYVKNLLK